MLKSLSPDRLARSANLHPWRYVIAWLVLLVVGMGAASTVGNVLTDEDEVYTTLESETADDLIFENLIRERAEQGPAGEGEPMGPQEFVLIHHPTLTVDDPAFEAFVTRVIADGQEQLGARIASIENYYETGQESLVSADRHTLLAPTILGRGDIEETAGDLIAFLDDQSVDGFEAVTGGEASVDHLITSTSESDLKGELLSLPVALVVLLVVFGALVAAGLPLLLGFMAIVISVGVVALIGQAWELSIFVTNIITMIGLAVGIDYSLLVVQRFREERRHGAATETAILRTGSTAGRSVLFSGMAVIVSLCGMFLVPHSIYRSLAAGAVVVVIVAVAAALTLLPAMLTLLGDKVNLVRLPFRGEPKNDEGGFWHWSANFVMRHAVISVIVSAGILIALSSFYLRIDLGENGPGSLPEGSSPRRAFELLDEQFNAGLLAPTDIAVNAPSANDPATLAAIDSLRQRLTSDARFGESSVDQNAAGTFFVIETAISGDSQADESFDAIRDLRDDYVPAAFANSNADIYVTGETASITDFRGVIIDSTPGVFAFVLGLSFIILLIVFRSIVVPLKALVMNLLSVGAAYGLMVLVFQEGFGAGLLGFQQVEVIEFWIPLFMFAILFGLSMDYHVFLLSRIREVYDATGDNRRAVASGVASTAGLITGAALIMVSVFAGFAIGDLVMFQQMGFGLGVAIFLDATIVRVVLVPASMALLGRWNWYLPSWLSWLPRVDVEGHAAAPTAAGSPAGGGQ